MHAREDRKSFRDWLARIRRSPSKDLDCGTIKAMQ